MRVRRTLCAMTAGLLLCAAALRAAETGAIKVLIITGDNAHNWKETTPLLTDLLTKAGCKVDVTETPRLDLVPEKLSKYDVLLLNYQDTKKGAAANPNSVWSDENKKAFVEAVKQGANLVVFHFAAAAFRGDSEFDKEYEKLTAGGWRKQGYHGKRHVFTVTVRKEHPITKGITSFQHNSDELYQNSLITPGSEILATAYSDPAKDPKNTGKDEPMIWINSYGKARVVQNAMGHDAEAMQNASFKTLLIRCVQWAATGKTAYPTPKELQGEK